MKKIISLICLGGLFALSAFAQLGTNTTQTVGAPGGVLVVMPGGTNSVAALTTNVYTMSVTNVGANGKSNVISYPIFIFPTGYQKELGIEIIEANIGASTNSTSGARIYSFIRSFDNAATFEVASNAPAYLTLTNSAPTAANGYTNTFLFDLPNTNATHIALLQIANTGTNQNVTNITVDAVFKNATQWHVVPPGSH
jgi:hypothetical protein